ncbi:hypothetical protein [Pseudoalteromonas rhizosphaerae]|uniref:Uncharacterized protein n=1 Tax=Pseudoalteromonas rhizosphaerae TaxID=2518973 RepID=A0ABW8L180_9GAMM
MPEYIIDMPQAGYGALIVNEAHCIFYDYMDTQLNVGSKHCEIEKYIFNLT